MPVSRLSLTDFRSYASAEIVPGPGFVLLHGENGAGKTNILEAVSLLTPGRGLRGAALSEMARQSGTGAFAVAAQLSPLPNKGGDDSGEAAPSSFSPVRGTGRPESWGGVSARVSTHAQRLPAREGGVSVGTGTLPTAPERREVRINGAPAAVNSLSQWLSVLWLTPAMDRLFSASTGDRRRFLDRLVLALEPSHAHHASRYEAAMRARNKLLADEAWDEAWLASLELAMAEHGTAIGAARERAVAVLGERLNSAPEDHFARASISLEGWASGDLATSLRANRQRDAAAGRAIEGPHRQDLAVTHRAKQMPAARSSTGEQKALLLGLVLAHAELVADRRGEPPILLLDEVAAHLDPKRRASLFERLERRGQVWMTATEAALFDGIACASRFRIEPGIIHPE